MAPTPPLHFLKIKRKTRKISAQISKKKKTQKKTGTSVISETIKKNRRFQFLLSTCLEAYETVLKCTISLKKQ